jgi:hypothetical protein
MGMAKNIALGAALALGAGCSADSPETLSNTTEAEVNLDTIHTGLPGRVSVEVSTTPEVPGRVGPDPTNTTVSTTTEVITTSPTTNQNVFSAFEDDEFYAPEYGDLPGETCAALALQHVVLGPEGMPPTGYFSMGTQPDGTPSIGGDTYVDPDSLLDSSDAVISSLVKIRFNPEENPALNRSVADALGAATTAEVAVPVMEAVYEVSNEDLFGPIGDAAIEDATAMLDQAREATNTALKSGCAHAASFLINSTMAVFQPS